VKLLSCHFFHYHSLTTATNLEQEWNEDKTDKTVLIGKTQLYPPSFLASVKSKFIRRPYFVCVCVCGWGGVHICF